MKMPTPAGQVGDIISRLAEAVVSVRPLIDVLAAPVHVSVAGGTGPLPAQWPNYGAAGALLECITARLGAPRLCLRRDVLYEDLGTFEQVVSDRLRIADAIEHLAPGWAESVGDVEPVVDQALADGLEGLCERAVVRRPDGTVLQAYATGNPRRPAVVIASACGMPARLCEDWLRFLGTGHYVITWETRGLFGAARHGFRGGVAVTEQALDLIAVMDHFGVAAAHVAGFCGGAVIALAAAALAPRRIRSLSLWHGDFEVGADAPKTSHQENLQALMAMAALSPADAANVREVLCNVMVRSTPTDLAHLVLYPYADSLLLMRYCLLNGAIMNTDMRSYLPAVKTRVLVVTSRDDDTAHPDGSRYVSSMLAPSTLTVTEHGNHLSLFRAGRELLEMAEQFIKEGTCEP